MLKKADSDLVRRQNRGLVLETLRSHGGLSRVQLGAETGLSPATVTTISAQLIYEGLVHAILADEPAEAPAKRGQPQVKLALNPSAANVLAVAISIDGVDLVFADFTGETRPPVTLRIDTYAMPKQEFAPRIAHEIRKSAASLGIPLSSIMRIGVAVQGVADTARGEIAWSPAFAARGVPVVAPLERILNIPSRIANNANMMAEALMTTDRKKYGGITAVIFMGHGIGLGLVLDGRVYSGATGRAAEFGHMSHMAEGPLCRCGRMGCIEAYVADYGIIRMADATHATHANIHAAVLPQEMRKTEAEAQAGRPQALQAFHRAGEVLGFGIARLIALINPERVVLAGPGTLGYGLMQKSVEAALEAALVHDLRRDIEIEVVPYGRNMITTGTLVETLRYLDRDVFADGLKTVNEPAGRKIA